MAVTATVELMVWDGIDNPVTVYTIKFDCEPVLDTYALSELPENVDSPEFDAMFIDADALDDDGFFGRAVKAGRVRYWNNGPTYCTVDANAYESYIADREADGQEAPRFRIVPATIELTMKVETGLLDSISALGIYEDDYIKYSIKNFAWVCQRIADGGFGAFRHSDVRISHLRLDPVPSDKKEQEDMG